MFEPKPTALPPAAPASTDLFHAQRRAARWAIIGLMLLWSATLVSPFFAYRVDVQNAEQELVAHLSDQVALQTQALGAHLELLRAVLQRLAEHPELTPEDGVSAAEVALLESAFGHSPLFSGGVALLSPSGERVWSDPPEMDLGASPISSRRWFQHGVEGRASVDLLEKEGEDLVVVVVPVESADGVDGLLMGELSTRGLTLPGARGDRGALVALLDAEGRLLLPAPPPPTLRHPELPERLQALVSSAGPVTIGGTAMLGAAAPVAGSGLMLAILEDASMERDRLKQRYLGQLAFHTSLLAGVMLLFTLLLWRSYHALLAADERMQRQATMAALGTASSVIAHEVKNALNGMKAALSMMRPTGGTGELPVRALRSQVERLGHLARSLLTFASPREVRYRSCDVRLLVEEALQAVEMIPESDDVQLERTLASDLFVKGDAALLVSVFDNLVRNAVEAGAVARDTGQEPSPRVEVFLEREGDEAVFVVDDNAGGVPSEFEPRLWEPFAVGRAKGIGLGLPMTRATVQAHGGSVTYIRTRAGSRFTVRLPLETRLK